MTFRFEEKIKLDNKKIFLFKKWLKLNKAIKAYPDREIYSIYFDNKNFQTYLDSIEGVVPRKKIRLRTYNFKNENINNFNKCLNVLENKYKINKSLILKNYIIYLLNNRLDLLNGEMIGELEYIIHNLENEDLCINYIYFCIINN